MAFFAGMLGVKSKDDCSNDELAAQIADLESELQRRVFASPFLSL